MTISASFSMVSKHFPGPHTLPWFAISASYSIAAIATPQVIGEWTKVPKFLLFHMNLI